MLEKNKLNALLQEVSNEIFINATDYEYNTLMIELKNFRNLVNNTVK